MKARIKSTGEIVDVDFDKDALANDYPPYRTNEIPSRFFLAEQLEWIDIKEKVEPDYWTRLRHQAAIAAMQGKMAQGNNFGNSREEVCNKIANYCVDVADALIKKLRGKEEGL